MQQPPPLPAVNPYAAPQARVEDVATTELMLAGRGVRLAAAIIDGLIWAIPFFAFIFIIPAMVDETPDPNAAVTFIIGLLGFAGFVSVLVVNCLWLHRWGQTIAKRMFGIKVLRSDGTPCALSRIVFARWLPVTALGQIPYLGPFVGLVDALMIFRSDHRTMHDLFADTIVVRA